MPKHNKKIYNDYPHNVQRELIRGFAQSCSEDYQARKLRKIKLKF